MCNYCTLQESVLCSHQKQDYNNSAGTWMNDLNTAPNIKVRPATKYDNAPQNIVQLQTKVDYALADSGRCENYCKKPDLRIKTTEKCVLADNRMARTMQ